MNRDVGTWSTGIVGVGWIESHNDGYQLHYVASSRQVVKK